MITSENVSLAFSRPGADGNVNSVQVLSDLNLEIRASEVCVIVGPSGAGKTTFLRLIQGLLRPSSGTIKIDGRPVAGPRLDCGFVFQNFGLLPWRSVQSNVEFGLQVRNVDRDKRRIIAQKYIEMVGLSGFEHHHPHELSGGMQQRVGLARAFAIDPRVLLMDEPFAALDAQTRETLQAELLQIQHRERKTVIFVTHSIDEAVLLADRVVVFTQRPSRVKEIIVNTLPHPRWESVEELRSDPQYAKLRLQIARVLKRMGTDE